MAPETHLPVDVSHMLPCAQSVLAAQVALHAVAPHAYAPHGALGGTLQLPAPSHAPGRVAVSSAQLAAPHTVDTPTKPAHVVAVMPSHCAAWQTFCGSPAGHAGRAPTVLPTMGVQVPAVSAALHASHCPVHAELQQTPSTQRFEEQWSAAVQATPLSPLGTHAPSAQYALVTQSSSDVQLVGQLPTAQR